MKEELNDLTDFEHPRAAAVIVYAIVGAITVWIVWKRYWPAIGSVVVIGLLWYTWPASKQILAIPIALYGVATAILVALAVVGYIVPGGFLERNWGEREG